MSDPTPTGEYEYRPLPVDDIVYAFEKAYRSGAAPRIEDFLCGDGPDRWHLLIELIHSELELRLRGGDRVGLAEYLTRYPALAHLPNELAAVLETELRLRVQADEEPDLGEYERQYSALGPRVREAFKRVGTAPPDVPGYEVLEKIAQGGMGVVYKARQVLLRREVALKLIRHDRLDGTAGDRFRARFRREAEAVGAVNHPHVVQVFETGESGGDLFIAMELVDGPSLQKRLDAGGVLDPRAAATLLEKVARAVHAVHERKIVHRDLKPDNILLTAAGELKVADFGLARPAEVSDGGTKAGVVLGTPEYMSPEQAALSGEEPTPAVDVYGLGAVLYACLTGRAPFPRESVQATLEKVRTHAVVAVRDLRPDCPRDLETICAKCLEKAPARRYASAEALADDLRRWLDGRPIRARPVRHREKAWKWVRRNPALALLAVAVLVGCLATTGSALVALTNARERAGADAARAAAEREAGDRAIKQLEAERARAVEKAGRADAERAAAFAMALQANDLRHFVGLVRDAERAEVRLAPQQQFDVACALDSLGESDESRRRLAALDADPTVPADLRAQVRLRLADSLMGTDDVRAGQLVRAARAGGHLPAAHLAYADALESTELGAAVAHLQEAASLDPAYFPARRLLGLYLLVSGRLDECVRVAEASRLITPSHPDVLFPLLMAYGFKGDPVRSQEVFELLRPSLAPELADPFEMLARYLPVLCGEFQASMTGNPGPAAELVREFHANRGPAKILHASAQWKPVTNQLFARTPAAFRDGLDDYAEFSFAYAAGRSFCEELSGDEVRIARLKANLDRRPEGFMRFIYAFTLFCRANGYAGRHGVGGVHGDRYRALMAEAGAAYLVAADTPGLLPVRASCLEGAALAYALAGKPGWAADRPDRGALEKSAAAVRLRMDLPDPHPLSRINLLVLASRNAEDWTAARRVLDSWEGQLPDERARVAAGAAALRADVEFKAGAFLPALVAARRVLAVDSGHAAMRQMETDCLAQMRIDPDRVAPPPRAVQPTGGR